MKKFILYSYLCILSFIGMAIGAALSPGFGGYILVFSAVAACVTFYLSIIYWSDLKE